MIPSSDGRSSIGKETIEVPAWRDPESGEIFLDDRAIAKIEQTKARLMGLLSPKEIKALRSRMGLSQAKISDLLQIGQKSWTRWETGRERPSRVINVLLRALADEKIDRNYLLRIRCPSLQTRQIWPFEHRTSATPKTPALNYSTSNAYKTESLVA
jgi:DNA-binding transcriptional regulator YiaG